MRTSKFVSGWLAGLVTASISVSAFGQLSEGPATVQQNNEDAWATLQQSIDVGFSETRFDVVLHYLQEQTGLQFVVHESAIENNLDEEQQITFELENTRTATCLDLMLDPYQCTYSIEDGVVLIVSTDAALDRLSVRVFDCRSLLSTIRPKQVPINYGFGNHGIGNHRPGGFSGGVFSVQDDTTSNDSAQAAGGDLGGGAGQVPNAAALTREVSASQQLTELIEEIVDPDSWESNGGSGRIYELNGMLVISQTEVNLRGVAQLLDELEPDRN